MRSRLPLLLVFGAIVFTSCSGSRAEAPATAAPEPTFAATAPPPAATLTPTPTPTPEPYNGAVARMRIPRIKVDAPIVNLGLIPGKSQLDVPKDEKSVGWYEFYTRPGFRGSAVFSGHVDFLVGVKGVKGVFWDLDKLEPGDELVVVMDNGIEYTYRVSANIVYPEESVPMGDIIWPKDPTIERVALITCAGNFNKVTGSYDSRQVVLADRVFPG